MSKSDGSDFIKRRQANGIFKYLYIVDFAFYLQLMLLFLWITNSLSKALQRKNQDILNDMLLMKSIKQQLYKLMENRWESLINKIFPFMKITWLSCWFEWCDSKNPRKRSNITNLHHYKVECFYTVLDMQIHEFASLSSINSFHEFDELKVMRLSEFYPKDFTLQKSQHW